MYKHFASVVLAAVLSLSAVVTQAQTAPDNKDIFEQTLNSESPYYYPTLMMRYLAGDTTLSEKDYYYLYYGYAYSDQYSPLAPIPSEDQTLMALEAANASPTEANMREIIRYATETLKHDPFSPSNLNFLVYAYGAIGDTVNERINYDRLNKVLAAITSSGTGMREDSPIHVIRFSHATDILGTLGLTVTKRLVVSRTTEYITVANEKGRQLGKGYYFDYSRVFWGNQDNIPQPEHHWKINDYPVGGYKKK